MDAKTAKKLAEQFSELGTLMEAISGTFRNGAGEDEGEGGDGKAGKAVRGGTASKGAKSGKTKITQDSLRASLKELAAAKGQDKMAEVLAEVGASRLPDVDEDDYQELSDAIAKAMEEEDEKPAGKGKKGKAEPAPDKDDVVKAYKKLLKADPKAAKKLLKTAQLDDIDELDEDDEGQLTDVMASITEALED